MSTITFAVLVRPRRQFARWRQRKSPWFIYGNRIIETPGIEAHASQRKRPLQERDNA